ncbi:MAG: bacteriohemerythrin [Treponema sp.]|jgi:hemerythrin|nr:bacteriohemerythrin [Treponema sp.]
MLKMIKEVIIMVVHPKKHVTWSDSYSMGVKIIDDQHKGLLDFVNDLFNHVSGNEKEEYAYFKDVIQQAVEYVKEHFRTEEKLMVGTKFPGYAEHKKAHDEFTLTVIKSVKDYESGKRLVLEKFAYFLKDWVLTHIAVMDKQYAEYFKKIATRKDNGKLTITKADIG